MEKNERRRLPIQSACLNSFLIIHFIADAGKIGFLTEFDQASTIRS
jgi:uncharacterized membrane protein YcgQ (UPF0703/DUF1980 family)